MIAGGVHVARRAFLDPSALVFALAVGCGCADASHATTGAAAETRAAPAQMPDLGAAPAVSTQALGAAPSPSHTHVLGKAVEKRTRWGNLFVPAGFASEDGAYDLVIHFHGAPETVKRAFERAGLNAVLFVMNLGNGAEAYDQRFRGPSRLPDLLQAVDRAFAATDVVPAPRLRRVALGSWSAGYAALSHLLASRDDADRVDAVLIGDGPHGKFIDRKDRVVDQRSMEPFVAFAAAAAEGKKLMAVTHSEIRTTGYASTSETGAYMASALHVPTRRGFWPQDSGMTMVSDASQRELHLQGYAGGDAPAHLEHLRRIDVTLWSYLRDRWSPQAPTTPHVDR